MDKLTNKPILEPLNLPYRGIGRLWGEVKRRFKTWLLACPGFEAACRLFTIRHVRAIMYHRFSEPDGSDARSVDRTTLEDQAKYIARYHTPWDPDRHLASLADKARPAGRCPVVVTVDDGYADFANVAFPVFQRHELPVMLFVATDFVDGRNWFWWDKLQYIINQAAGASLNLDLGEIQMSFDLSDKNGRAAAWHRIADHCRFTPDHEKESLIASVAERLRVALPRCAPHGFEAISWQQATAMAAEGCQFGAHTLRHPILSRLEPAKAEVEIYKSQARLAEMLGREISWFCYPQGGPADWSPAVRAIVAKQFRGCYLAYQTLEDPDDPYTMPRYGVSRDMTDFRWTLCGAEYIVLRMRRLLGMSTGVGPGYWAEHEHDAPRTDAQPRSKSGSAHFDAT